MLSEAGLTTSGTATPKAFLRLAASVTWPGCAREVSLDRPLTSLSASFISLEVGGLMALRLAGGGAEILVF